MSAEVAIAPLTTAEVSQLAECEAVIERGRKTFVEVGAALATVRDGRLWRDGFASFEDYCERRWEFSRQRGYQLIEAAEIAGAMSTIVDAPPVANEAQARELAKVAPEDQPEVWQEAVARAGGEVPPARVVAEVVAERQAPAAAMASAPPVAEAVIRPSVPILTSESNEWYTPARYVEAAREVLGEIDLDPASCEVAQATVQAAAHFTIDDDGLAQPWAGRVWLNPPYGVDENRRSNQGRWSAKLIESYRAGDVTTAVLCVNALTSAPWFQALWDFPICFTDHRVTFDQPAEAEKRDAPMNGTAFVYLGPDVEAFARVFSEIGAVVQRVEVA